MAIRPVPVHKVDAVSARARELCVALGYIEVRTSSFLSAELAARFTHWSQGVNVIRNPISSEEPALRTSLVPLLLRTKQNNVYKGTHRSPLFELSESYGTASGKPIERTCLALLDDAGFASLRGALDALFGGLGISAPVEYAEYGDANFAAGRSAELTLGGKPLGLAGETTPELASLFDLREPPAVAELDFGLLVDAAVLARRHQPLPRFPAVRRDLCMVIDEAVTWAALRARAATAAGPLTESIEFLSEFRGGSIQPGSKALAFSVTCRAKDRTLTGKEADDAIAAVANALKQEFSAELRA
jgi:phenylalanyl-tRNA synthetase beta chain